MTSLLLIEQSNIVIAIAAILVVAAIIVYAVARGRNVKFELPGGVKGEIDGAGKPSAFNTEKGTTIQEQPASAGQAEARSGALGEGAITGTEVGRGLTVSDGSKVNIHVGHSVVQTESKQTALRKKESA